MGEKMFYIQAHGYVGNSMLWWRINYSGYTTDLDKAGKYTEIDAEQICSNGNRNDIAWPVEYIDNNASRHIDIQTIDPTNSVIWQKK